MIEPARVDMAIRCGKVSIKNKIAFVLRDSPMVGTHLVRLSTFFQSINTAIIILAGREGNREILAHGPQGGPSAEQSPDGNAANFNNGPPPPAYHEIMQWRDEKRRSVSHARDGSAALDEARRCSSGSPSPQQLVASPMYSLSGASLPTPSPPMAAPPSLPSDPPLLSTSASTGKQQPIRPPTMEIDSGLEVHNRQSSTSRQDSWETPSFNRPQPNMDGADGLQVVMSDLPEVCPNWTSTSTSTSTRTSYFLDSIVSDDSSSFSAQQQPQRLIPGVLLPGQLIPKKQELPGGGMGNIKRAMSGRDRREAWLDFQASR
jgi:hypothetical protein